MIRRSPAELYIKYLIVHPSGYDNGQIKEILLYAQLDALGEYYLDGLRDQLAPIPRPFLPRQRAHRKSQAYLLQNGLHYFFWPDNTTKVAFKILKSPRIKEFVETNIITYTPYEAVAKFLTEARDFQCEPIDIQRYRDIFWNVDLVDRTELKMLFDLRLNAMMNHPDPDVAAQARSYKFALQTDAKKIAVDLPYSPTSAMVAQIRMGRMPSNADFARIVEATRCMAVVRAFEAISAGREKGDFVKFKMYASGAKDLTEILQEVARPEDDLKEQLSAIALRADQFHLPTLSKLGSSNYNEHVLEAHGESMRDEFETEEPKKEESKK